MSRRAAPWWLWVVAASFAAYFALLLYCDINRPEPLGVHVVVTRGGVYVAGVAAGLPAAAAGLKPGDRIAIAHRRPVRDRADWAAVEGLLEGGSKLPVTIERAGETLTAQLHVGLASPGFWLTSAALVLTVVRLMQLASLVIALLVAFKRPDDQLALLGAWLLASGSVFCIAFPAGMAAVWQRLPLPIGGLLWLPFTSSLGIGAMLFAFFARFPRPVLARRWILLACIPAAILVGQFVRSYAGVVYHPSAATRAPQMRLVMMASAGYAAAGLIILALNYRRLTDVNDRRRVRVILPGSGIALISAVFMLVTYWGGPRANLTGSMFTSPSTAVGALLLLALPVSFAYAILRRRLFDLSTLIRQGVRYALARRVVLSLVPLVGAILVADVAWQGQRSLREVVAARRTLYFSLIGVAIFAHIRRDRWLEALDLRFFRERYDAQRLLQEVTASLRAAGSLDSVAPHVVAQIEAALHPQFAALMLRTADRRLFMPIASAPDGAAPPALPADSKLGALAGVVGGPVRVGGDADAILLRQLPPIERDFIRDARLDLVVPVCPAPSQLEALIVLGAKRSEEPYSNEDIDLLSAVCAALGLVLERPRPAARAPVRFEECPVCGACYEGGTGVCTNDTEPLQPGSTEHLLAGRYRLDRRLGEGGMGKVYTAMDVSLRRPVAVKLLRDEWTRTASSTERFRREARIAASFTHPNVVTVHDFGVTTGGHAFLVMEMLDGSTLRGELRRSGRLSLNTAAVILNGVCAAVDAAHRRGLVHADLKPENVFIAHNDVTDAVKVLDFGLASSVLRVPEDTRSGGVVLGTPPYMAPEQLRNEPPQPAWDQWALGVIAYELVTGVHPFAASAGTWPEPLGAHLPGALAPMRAFFERALAVDPARRPASARVFLDRFVQAAAESVSVELAVGS